MYTRSWNITSLKLSNAHPNNNAKLALEHIRYAHEVNKMTHAIVSLIDMLVDFGFYVNTYELEVVASHVAKVMDPSTDVTYQNSSNRSILNPDFVETDIMVQERVGAGMKIVPINDDDANISKPTPKEAYRARRDRQFALATEVSSSSVVRSVRVARDFSFSSFTYS